MQYGFTCFGLQAVLLTLAISCPCQPFPCLKCGSPLVAGPPDTTAAAGDRLMTILDAQIWMRWRDSQPDRLLDKDRRIKRLIC